MKKILCIGGCLLIGVAGGYLFLASKLYTSTQSKVSYDAIPDGLSDCKFYILQNSAGADVSIVRCPLSNTAASTIGKIEHPVTIAASSTSKADNAALTAARAEINRANAQLAEVQARIAAVAAAIAAAQGK